jgi:CubicO group peptidase (beta-lactamase class C family)
MSKHHNTTRRAVLTTLGAVPLAAGGVLGASTSNASAGVRASGRIPDGLRPGGELDRFIARLAADDMFSGTVLVSRKNEPVLARSHLMADKSRQIPNGTNTVFDIASITKFFTVVALSQLAERGKIGYGETVGTYLDGFRPEVANTVTVHQLLLHTSGLGRPATNPPEIPGSEGWGDDLEEIFDGTMAYLRQLRLNFTPGTGNEYSNDGYFTLGAIVAQVSGQSYYDYVREHIFEPVGMTSTDFRTLTEWRENRAIAHPYAVENGAKVDVVEQVRSIIGHPAAGIFTSAPDLARFVTALQAVRDNPVLEPAFVHLITSPKQVFAGTRAGGYSVISEWVGDQEVNHAGGGAPGVSASVGWYPGTDWATVVLSNYGEIAETIRKLAQDIITEQR